MGFTIWIRKFTLEEIKFFVQGHTSREELSQGLNPALGLVLLNPHTGAMKKCSTSDVIREMQIRAMKFLIKWPKS